MLDLLKDAADQAVRDGYRGLWATGDLTWELGPQQPAGTGMGLFTLRTAEEVRAPQFPSAEGEVDGGMVAIAKAIIAQRTGAFDPSTYKDPYQEALYELIEAKMKGLTVTPRRPHHPSSI